MYQGCSSDVIATLQLYHGGRGRGIVETYQSYGRGRGIVGLQYSTSWACMNAWKPSAMPRKAFVTCEVRVWVRYRQVKDS